MKVLAEAIEDYLALRRGLGFKLKSHSRCLKEFASFLEHAGEPGSRPGWLCNGRRNHSMYSRWSGPPG